MNLNVFMQRWKDTKKEIRLSRIALVGLLVVTTIQAYSLARKDTAVILVPPTLSKEVTVARNQADQGMKEAWSLYGAQLMGNVTPDNASFMREAIGQLLHPAIYDDVMMAINQDVEAIKRDRVTQRFEPRDIIFEPQTDKAFVTGYSIIEARPAKTSAFSGPTSTSGWSRATP